MNNDDLLCPYFTAAQAELLAKLQDETEKQRLRITELERELQRVIQQLNDSAGGTSSLF